MPHARMAAIAAAFALGILCFEYMTLTACMLLAVGALLAGLVLLRKHPRLTLVTLAVIFALGVGRHALSREVPPDDISLVRQQIRCFEGVVVSDPEQDTDRLRVVFRVSRALVTNGWITASGNVMLTVYSDESAPLPRLDYGQRARISASPYPPHDPTNPSRFSWRLYLARQRVFACASVRNGSQLQLLDQNGANPLVWTALRVKRYLTASINRIHPSTEASVIVGMVLGTYSYLPAETFTAFSRTGTLHLLAASGYNCFILLFLSGPILRFARISAKTRAGIVISFIVIYAMMVGAKPSLVRAAIMSSLLLLGVPLKRVPNTTNLFFAAGLLILIVRPGDLFDVGFQLSFLAVWSLITTSPIIEAILERAGVIVPVPRLRPRGMAMITRKLAGGAQATLVATLAVTLVTLPVVAYYFNYVSLVSIPANIAVEIGVPVVFAVGFLSPIVAWIPIVGDLTGAIGTLTTRLMLWTVTSLGSLRYSAVSVASPQIATIAGYYLVLYAVLNLVRSKYADG